MRQTPILLYAVGIAFLAACSDSSSDPEVSVIHLLDRVPNAATTDAMFTDLPSDQTGLEFSNEILPDHRVQRNNIGSGLTSGDVDGNGLPDLYFVSQDGQNRLFIQTSPWKFQDVTDASGVAGAEASGTGAAFLDVDNDGDLDLFVCNQDAADQLFINHGHLKFSEESSKRGVAHPGPSVMANYCDYDRDGDLDIYLVTYREFTDPIDDKRVRSEGGIPSDLADSYARGPQGYVELGRRDLLYQNDGTGNFTNVAEASGITQAQEFGLSATWLDYNNDDWPDIYVSNDYKGADHLYHNNGDGTFSDVAPRAMPFLPWFAMGSDSGDLNNDGWMDIVVGDMVGTTHYRQKLQMGDINETRSFLTSAVPRQYMRNTLFVNTGTGHYLEGANLAGMASTDWTWAVRIADLDCDGREDVFFSNGFYVDARDTDRILAQRMMAKWQSEGGAASGKRYRDHLRELGFDPEVFMGLDRPPLNQKNLVFRNLGDLQFENVSDPWGLGKTGVSFGTTYCDLDADGDLDIVVANTFAPVSLYRNEGASGNRIIVKLRGTRSNSFGIGSRVTARVGDEIFTRFLSGGRGYQSSDAPEVHIGLGTHKRIDSLEIRWPSGIVQELQDLEAGNAFTIREPNKPAELKPARQWNEGTSPATLTQFEVDRNSGIDFRHFEQPFDDFETQTLLPFQFSAMGPGMAWGDANGDGKEDLWIGGGFGQRAAIYLKERDFRFTRSLTTWSQNSQDEILSDDMGGLWFDADKDGDQDLFVVSGGVESPVSGLQDRLYINDGSGNLSAAREALPIDSISGSVVSSADFDRDGDLDLFVGGRSVPGSYPVTPISKLLVNEGGKFSENFELAPGLNTVGLVTGSLWSDIDQDGWIDLLVTLEWGAVSLFKNHGGRLINETETRGLADNKGWWNGITGADVDNDGDIDFVATNTGLNTKYQIKGGKPRQIYYADFDGDGVSNIVEAKYEGETLYPERGRSCSMLAMPVLEKKFPTYRLFASSSLAEVYSPTALSEALHHEVNYLETSVLLNDGNGNFEVKALPRIAQITPSLGVAMEDFDGDGNVDIVLGQNFYPNQPETGWMNMGLGQYLRGSGDGTFEPVGPAESGIIMREDARSLTVSDLDEDGWPDFIVALNDGPIRVFRNRGSETDRTLTVKLRGKAGNLSAAGASVTVTWATGRIQAKEIYAGSSYLSQSSAALSFGVPQGDEIRKISVRWPGGKTSQYLEGFESGRIEIEER